MASHPEVVILGAGLAGMTAAYHLRDRDVVVVESRDRVGGRTLSGEHDTYWYNSGAQFVWDARTVALCSELGLDVLGGEGALSAVFVNGRLATAPDANRLFVKMPVPWVEKARFGLTITRLRRIAWRRRAGGGRSRCLHQRHDGRCGARGDAGFAGGQARGAPERTAVRAGGDRGVADGRGGSDAMGSAAGRPRHRPVVRAAEQQRVLLAAGQPDAAQGRQPRDAGNRTARRGDRRARQGGPAEVVPARARRARARNHSRRALARAAEVRQGLARPPEGPARAVWPRSLLR